MGCDVCGIKTYDCDKCPRSFTRSWTLKRHQQECCQQVKPKKIYSCPYCQKGFTRLPSLKRHYKVCRSIRGHNGIQAFFYPT